MSKRSRAAGEAITWPLAFAIAVVSSFAGDVVGYSVGRLTGERFIVRHGHLLGYAGFPKQKVEWLFRRWGGVAIPLTRTLVSHLSSLANFLAGLSRYSLAFFGLTHPSAQHEATAIAVHVPLLNAIAPTVRISKAPPFATYQPNAVKMMRVAIAIAMESIAAHGLHRNRPIPAST